MRIYISGPMRGKPDLNFPAFDEASMYIRAQGHIAISPADLNRDYPCSADNLEGIVALDIKVLLTCDAIALLPGWEHSVGAKAELGVALFRQLLVLDANNLKPIYANLIGVAVPPPSSNL